ncbi:MAG: PHP domain-containing protein [Oscillospiraceae bacterium]|nr:PHP domain-containing protein [Oscillospiraceae bacterium]
MEYLYETHVHTSPVSACASSTPAEQVRAYKDRGYAGIIITDHFINGNSSCPQNMTWEKKMQFFISGYEEAKKEGDKCGLDVFFGWEYSVSGSDFLTYGIPGEFLFDHPEMWEMTIEQYSRLIRGNGGYIAQAHPYRDSWWIANPFPADPNLLDGIEVYNATMPGEVNAQAQSFAALHNLPVQAGSDSHSADIPIVSGIGLEKKAESISDIINALKNGKARLITH